MAGTAAPGGRRSDGGDGRGGRAVLTCGRRGTRPRIGAAVLGAVSEFIMMLVCDQNVNRGQEEWGARVSSTPAMSRPKPVYAVSVTFFDALRTGSQQGWLRPSLHPTKLSRAAPSMWGASTNGHALPSIAS